MGKVKNDWQDRDYVLKWFGGGFIKSHGGGSAVKAWKSGSRRRKITIVRSQLAKELVEEWGLSLTETSRHLGVSPSAIAKTLYRLDKHSPVSQVKSRMSFICYIRDR